MFRLVRTGLVWGAEAAIVRGKHTGGRNTQEFGNVKSGITLVRQAGLEALRRGFPDGAMLSIKAVLGQQEYAVSRRVRIRLGSVVCY